MLRLGALGRGAARDGRHRGDQQDGQPPRAHVRLTRHRTLPRLDRPLLLGEGERKLADAAGRQRARVPELTRRASLHMQSPDAVEHGRRKSAELHAIA